MTAAMAGAIDAPGFSAVEANIQDRVEGLIDVMGRLGALLRREIAAVRDRAPERVGAMMEEKQTLATAYADRMRELRRDAAKTGKIQPGLMARLKTAGEAIRPVIEENARALKATKTAHEKLIKAVSDAVVRKHLPVVNYSKTGAYGQRSSTYRQDAVPIALDQQV
jgi:hypothetical protein